MKRIPLLLGVTCLLLATGIQLRAGASDKKKDVFTIRIHGEASPEDGEKFSVPVELVVDHRKTTLSIMPLLSEHDIKSVYPFKAPDNTGGAYLRLDGHGANLLTEYSIERMGRSNILAVMINGRQVTDLIVDKAVRDGIFVIPSGMTMAEEARLVNAFPLMGQENSKNQKKKKQPFAPANIMLPPKASDLSGASAPVQ
ncbi:MAG: hypothetical protein K8R57_00665 [Verrucomicrobia bacterium]|nr:hypothetical protein [Verrucomicrobiota bacterium]